MKSDYSSNVGMVDFSKRDLFQPTFEGDKNVGLEKCDLFSCMEDSVPISLLYEFRFRKILLINTVNEIQLIIISKLELKLKVVDCY